MRSGSVSICPCARPAGAPLLQAVALCVAGHGTEVDPWVAGLGYRLRLSDQVWSACATSVAQSDPQALDTQGHNNDIACTGRGEGGGGGVMLNAYSAAAVPVVATAEPFAAAVAAASFTSAAAGSDVCVQGQREQGPLSEPQTAEAAEAEAVVTRRMLPQDLDKPAPPSILTPLVCDEVLPAALVHRLAAAFDPAGVTPYWRQHRYGRQSTPFFSYLYPLVRHLWPGVRTASHVGILWHVEIVVARHQHGENHVHIRHQNPLTDNYLLKTVIR